MTRDEALKAAPTMIGWLRNSPLTADVHRELLVELISALSVKEPTPTPNADGEK